MEWWRPDEAHNRKACLRYTVLAVALVGCAADHDAGDVASPNVNESDSAGVRIVESSGTVLETVLPWTVDTLPAFQAGQAGGDPPSEFHRINGMTMVAGGNLVVVDEGSGELRWFDHSGQSVARTGGIGDGPGEFRRPVLVPQFDRDSLLIFDRGSRRLTWVAEDGSGHRVQTFPEGAALMTGAPTAALGATVLFRVTPGGCPSEGYCENPLFVRWVDPGTAEADTLRVFVWREVVTRELAGGIPSFIEGPFNQVGLVAAGPEGPIVEGDANFELKQFDRDGNLSAIFRVDATSRPANAAALNEMILGRTQQEELAEVMRGIFDQMPMPEVLPAFRSLQVDRLGWIWAERFRLHDDEPPVWLVFDPSGRAHGTIRVPMGLEVHEIGEDYILGRWVDEMGVESVRSYRLDR